MNLDSKNCDPERKKKTDGGNRIPIANMAFNDLRHTLKRDFAEIRDFYLKDEEKTRLESMHSLRRWLFLFWWLIKNLFLKLTPVRRLLLVVGAIFISVSDSSFFVSHIPIRIDFKSVGTLVIVFILMLELRDKLLARGELAEGRAVQKGLMPQACPEIGGWDSWFHTQPANDVGGDLVDCITLDDRRFGLVLGDVSGKGLPAALLMAKLQATIRALAADAASPAELGMKINHIFHRDTQSGNFATLVYLEVEIGSGRLQLLNAGHMPPFVRHLGRIRLTSKGDAGIGLLTDSHYRAHEEILEPGDMLIVYSDGVNECLNEQGEAFGSERLQRLLEGLPEGTAAEAGQRILETLKEFMGRSRVHDDQTLLILKRNR